MPDIDDLAIDRDKGKASVSSCPSGKPTMHGPVPSTPAPPSGSNIKT